ncbi:ribosome maturation factor RimM, partial [Streptomyces fulvissimus]|nr:ribosome maturation factor RimM [Streptomyces microflavus]
VMVPFVAEIVAEIDLEEQRAVITPPPGLIDDRAVIASARDVEQEGAGDEAPDGGGHGAPGRAGEAR